MARTGDRVVLAHVRRAALLEWLGTGALRAAVPDLPVAAEDDDRWLDALCASDVVPPGVTLETMLLDGEPAAALAALAKRLDAAAIIAAPARRGALREFVLGSTLLHLLRTARLPVVVVQADGASVWRSAAAAVTADPSGFRVLDAAQSLAGHAALHLVHAWRVPDEGRLRWSGIAAERLQALRDWARGAAEGALGELRHAAPAASTVLLEGHPGSTILDWGRHAKPDVLLVAAHRGAPSEERLLGSVTQFLLYHWPGDLILVP